MIQYYHYESQLRSYLLQFCAIFYGLRVRTGKGECEEQQFITVPIVIGHKDRVVAAVMSGNTQNRVFSLPTMAAHLQNIALAPERRRTPGIVDQRVTMPVGGIFPNDLTVIKRAAPVPYNITVDLTIYASNTDQLHQILEQILVLFNPDVQIQKSDGPFDWTKLTKVELTDIANEENYPSGTERRVIQWTLTFEIPIYLSIPMGVKDDLVRKIIIQIGDMGRMQINEVDAAGNITRFDEKLAEIRYDTTTNPPTVSDGTDRNGDGQIDGSELTTSETTIEAIRPPVGPIPPEPEPLP